MMVDRQLQGKYQFFKWLSVAVFALLVLRLAALQIWEGQLYSTKAQQNQFRFLPIRAPRGDIVLSHGYVLAENKIVNTISIVRQQVSSTDLDRSVNNLASLLQDTYPEVDVVFIKKLLNEHKGLLYEPVVIKRDISIDIVTRLEERRMELPGVVISKDVVRVYPNNDLACHILGYVGEIGQAELDQKRDENYKPGDLIGRYGLEAQYEKQLRGQDGFQQVEVDVSGRPVSGKSLITVSPKQGDRLTLTIDEELQKTLESSMDQAMASLRLQGIPAQAGSAVVLNVKTGAVLAMTSRPTFDPNKLVPPVSSSVVKEYLNPPSSIEPPMMNRAISSRYPPGSTFKPITGMAALESGKLSTGDYVVCHGAFVVPHLTIGCDGVHGMVSLLRAMAVSCNVFFIEAGRKAGVDMLDKVGHEFGLDSKTGIDLPDEISGLLPGPDWKKAVNVPLLVKQHQKKLDELNQKYTALLDQATSTDERNKVLKRQKNELSNLNEKYRIDYNWNTNWQQYETYIMSIGQGDDAFTPVELANYVATLTNGGNRMRPYLVQKIEDRNGHVIASTKPTVNHKVDVSPQTMQLIREAMVQVTQPGGTASGLFNELPFKVGAKTGTAESGRAKNKYHGVFIAFAPADNPEIAFAGLVEYGFHGSGSAGPVAAQVFKQYFGLNKPPVTPIPAPNSIVPQRTHNATPRRTGTPQASPPKQPAVTTTGSQTGTVNPPQPPPANQNGGNGGGPLPGST